MTRACVPFSPGSEAYLSGSISGWGVTTHCSKLSEWEYSQPHAAHDRGKAMTASTPLPLLRNLLYSRKGNSGSLRKVEGVPGSLHRPYYCIPRVAVSIYIRVYRNIPQGLPASRAERWSFFCSDFDFDFRTGSSRCSDPYNYYPLSKEIKRSEFNEQSSPSSPEPKRLISSQHPH